MFNDAATFDIFPALHLVGGRVIDLAPMQAGQAGQTGHGSVLDERDPLTIARHWIEQGASWINVVNVDATFDEDASHGWPLIEQLCKLPVKVQYGGGMRTADDIRWAMRVGVTRVLVGTAAVESPRLISEAIAEHGREHLALAITTGPEGEVMTHGWQSAGGLQAVVLAIQMYRLGIATAVHTRLERDGSMTGADLATSCELAELSGMNVIVGGEVRDMSGLVDCYNRPGITGALIGKALQNGTIDLASALAETRATLAFESGLPRWKQEQSTLKARLRHTLTLGYLARHLPDPAGARVLDVGSGTGVDALALASAGASVDVVDRSLSMLADLREQVEREGVGSLVTEHAIDIRQVPRRFEADAFDAVLAHGVIQYSADWEQLLHAMIAPLAVGGLLSLITRNWHAEPYGIDPVDYDAAELPALLERTRAPSRVFDADVLLFSAPYLKGWLEQHGFEIVGDYGLICRHDVPELPQSPGEQNALLEKLGALESAMGERSPFRETARYLHLIARRGSS